MRWILAALLLVCVTPSARAETCLASWYGREHHGRPTASGERFDMNAMTAAHRQARLGSHLLVTDLSSGRSIRVRINDRGPYVGGRCVDLSRAAADALGFTARGLARVRVEYVGGPPRP